MIKESILYLRGAEARNQALAQGEIIDLKKMYPEETTEVYDYPVYCSAAAWKKIQSGSRMTGDLRGLIWDVLFMSQHPCIEDDNLYCYVFDAVIPDHGDWIIYRQFKRIVLFETIFLDDKLIFILLPEE